MVGFYELNNNFTNNQKIVTFINYFLYEIFIGFLVAYLYTRIIFVLNLDKNIRDVKNLYN